MDTSLSFSLPSPSPLPRPPALPLSLTTMYIYGVIYMYIPSCAYHRPIICIVFPTLEVPKSFRCFHVCVCVFSADVGLGVELLLTLSAQYRNTYTH